MMATILSFCLKSAICSAVFVAYYLLVLKHVKMNSFNRAYLLLAALLSVLLPFVRFRIFGTHQVAMPDLQLLAVSATGTGEAIEQPTGPSGINWPQALGTAYFAVTALMVLKIVAKLIWVYGLKRKGQVMREEGYELVKTDDPRAPFSFMNLLFWPVHMRQNSPEGNNILMHELAHIRQRHTIDKIVMQLILAACWLNPFNWLIKTELWLQHEFLADRHAVKDGNSDTFARMLLYSVVHSDKRSVINPFFQSPVKRRLLMLAQPSRSSYSILRRFLTLPLLAATVFLIAADTKKAPVVRAPKKIVLVLDAAHGGKDGGGKSIYGALEKDMTLAICKKLVALSEAYNIEIISTRDADVYATVEERVRISNGTDDAVFLSVHMHKNEANGVQDNSYALGVNPQAGNYDQCILLASSIASRLKSQNLPVKVADFHYVYVIRESRHPALLLECGNLDDAANMALLNDEARTETLCRNILSGVVDYNARLRNYK